MLAVRLVGSPPHVAAAEQELRIAGGGRLAPLRGEEAQRFWQHAAEGFATKPVVFRVGGLPDGSDGLLDLLQHQMGDDWVLASPTAGTARWAGDTSVDRLIKLRRALRPAKSHSRSSERRGRCARRSDTSEPTAKGSVHSSQGCATPSTPTGSWSKLPKPLNE